MLEKDKLNHLFELQGTLQERLNNDRLVGNQSYINIMSLALIDEVLEALRETPWKPWKHSSTLNLKAYNEEIIDAWHFLINLSLAGGMNADDVYNMFLEKNKENHNRQGRGY